MKRISVCLLLCFLLLLPACRQQEEIDTVLMTINGEPVEAVEGRLYLEMTRQIYEERGGQEIWTMDLRGRDSARTASDNALDSLIRTKVTAREFDASRLTDSDLRIIERSVALLRAAIGEERMQVLSLSEKDLERYMEESYRAYRFESSMSFLPGTMEDELNAQVDGRFVAYEVADRDSYLDKVRLDAIMIYTGVWIDDAWVQYPASQREEKLKTMQKAQQAIEEGLPFSAARILYSEDRDVTDCPLFNEGVIRSGSGTTGLYRGQIQSAVADTIFKTPSGETTEILDTEYGYLLVQVHSFQEPEAIDYQNYRTQLVRARQQYRMQLEKELSEEQLESEYLRALSETDIVIHEEVWNRIVQGE